MGLINFTFLLNLPIGCFFLGIILGFLGLKLKINIKLKELLTFIILLTIGLKGGISLPKNFDASSSSFFSILLLLSIWGFLQPLLSFFVLKKVTTLEPTTIAVIGASFGSVSIITFVTGVTFLENLEVDYQKIIIPILAVMELPAIVSGVYLAKRVLHTNLSMRQTMVHSFLNKATISILIGLVLGVMLGFLGVSKLNQPCLSLFNFLVALFLFDIGLGIASGYKKIISLPLLAFGCYMPLISSVIGLSISYFLQLDIGTGTLVVLLCASASYIAVPAAMKMILPQADEKVYLPLSLGVTFPFNVVLGIPLYYYFACKLLI